MSPQQHPLNVKDEAIKLMAAGKLMHTQIAAKLNCPIATLNYWRKEAGLPLKIKPYPDSVKKEAVKLLDAGHSFEYVATKFNCNIRTLHHWRHKLSKTMPKTKGYSASVREEAVKMLTSGRFTAKQIAAKFGCCTQILYKWKRLHEQQSKMSYTSAEKVEAIQLLNAGYTDRDVIAKIGISSATLHAWKKSHANILKSKKKRNAYDPHSPKASLQQVDMATEIIKLFWHSSSNVDTLLELLEPTRVITPTEVIQLVNEAIRFTTSYKQ